MAVADKPGPRRQHIRSIRHYFLSGSTDAFFPSPPQAACLPVRLGGTPDSPWLLPFAVALGLAAATEGQPCLLSVPARLLAAAARLCGASPRQLGACFGDGPPWRTLDPFPGLSLASDHLLPLLSRRPGLRWIFSVWPEGGRGPWLYLHSAPGAEYRDPRAQADGLFYLLGLDHVPAPRGRLSGVWGNVGSMQLLDPERPYLPPFLWAPPTTRRQFAGYLTALRQGAAHSFGVREASG
jgi:hypothetical protein